MPKSDGSVVRSGQTSAAALCQAAETLGCLQAPCFCLQLHPHSPHRPCLHRAGSSVRFSQLSPCSLPACACGAQPRAQRFISHPTKLLLKPFQRCPGSAPAPRDVPGAVGERWARAGFAHQIAPGHLARLKPEAGARFPPLELALAGHAAALQLLNPNFRVLQAGHCLPEQLPAKNWRARA